MPLVVDKDGKQTRAEKWERNIGAAGGEGRGEGGR